MSDSHKTHAPTRRATNPVMKKAVKLHTWDEVEAYKAKHLKLVAYGPKGQPIYNGDEVAALNIQFPDE